MRALASAVVALFGVMAFVGCSEVAPLVGPQQTSPPRTDGGPLDEAGVVSFARDIRPLMERFPSDPAGPGCKACHYRTQPNHVGLDLGGLDLSTLGALREGGGTSGARIVVPGRPEESAIIQKLRGTYPFGTRMPKSGPPFWSAAEIDLLARWIAQGAKGEDGE